MDATEIGPRLKALRNERRFSLQVVADGSGLSKSFLSLVENGESDISIGRLVRLVKFYGIPVSQLLGENAHGPTLVARGEQRCVPSEAEGISVYFLAPDSDRKMLPLIVEIAPGGASSEPVSHEGEEFVHVTEGSVAVDVGGESLTLHVGDSVYFDGERPHAYRNVTSDVARLFLVVTPPTL